MKENKIVIEQLTKYYGKKCALNHISLTVGQGMFGLLGRNGAGKTTLMKIIASLLPVSKGNVTVCGFPISEPKKIREIIGYLPQEFSMYPSMTVAEAMDYFGILSKMSRSERKKASEQLLEQVNLINERGKKIKALSGGMKRRLGIAQALLNNPKVLIVDEPTAGLDPEERIRFRNLLSEEARSRIVILSTHIVSDIEAACENIAVLNEGNLLYHGTVEKLVGSAEGHVFTMEADRRELPLLRQQYLITAMHDQGKKIFVRFVSQNKPNEGVPAAAGIEDAYMLYLHCQDINNKAAGGERHAFTERN